MRIDEAFRGQTSSRDPRLPVSVPGRGVVRGGSGMVDSQPGLPVASESGRAPVRRRDQHASVGHDPLGMSRRRARRIHAADRKRQRREQPGVGRVRHPAEQDARRQRLAPTPARPCRSSRLEQAALPDARRGRSPARVVRAAATMSAIAPTHARSADDQGQADEGRAELARRDLRHRGADWSHVRMWVNRRECCRP